MPRPPKLTPELQATIERALRAGVPVRWAAEAAGIHNSTYYAWLARGDEWMDHDDVPDDEAPYAEFSSAMRRARAEGLARPAVELYNLIMDGNVDASVRLQGLRFLLTHADRDNWHPLSAATAGLLAEDTIIELAWDA